MEKMSARSTSPEAQKFAAIAAECARVCGVAVRLTPLDEVRVQVGKPVIAPDAPDAAQISEREVVCIGVRFDDEYVIVRLPTGGFRALKVDVAGRVVQRLEVRGGFRAQVSRVFGALIWDRLKRGSGRYEPQLALLPADSAVPVMVEAAHIEGPDPAPVSRKVEALTPRPRPKAKARPPEPSAPPV